MNEPVKVNWRYLHVGSSVWVPWGTAIVEGRALPRGWRPGTVESLGKNRQDETVVHIRRENGKMSHYKAGELYFRKPALNGTDKPCYAVERAGDSGRIDL